MKGKKIDLCQVIDSAWTNTLGEIRDARNTADRTEGKVNREASGVWVDCLGKEFQKCYCDKYHRVFWMANTENQGQFRLSELLFDISVCQVEEVPSIAKGVLLQFVSSCHWQVESELDDSDSREITKDFSKLVMGHSAKKLFISSHQGVNQTRVKELCSHMAQRCAGQLFLCFVDHPRNWGGKPVPPVLFRWKDNDWRPSARDRN